MFIITAVKIAKIFLTQPWTYRTMPALRFTICIRFVKIKPIVSQTQHSASYAYLLSDTLTSQRLRRALILSGSKHNVTYNLMIMLVNDHIQ